MYQFYQQWQQQKISDQECALHFFLHDYLRKYPHKKLQKRYDMGMLDANMLYQFNFKKVKGKAIDALYAYCQGQWNCQLFTQVLSAVEILTLQSQGIRPLTIIPQDHWQVIEHKSDGFEFFVHDLEHAYMFFFDTHRYQQQCIFFQRILTSLQQGFWQDLLQDQYFKNKFDYLVSDMNTHIQHYYFYLKAIVPLGEFKKYTFLFQNLIDHDVLSQHE